MAHIDKCPPYLIDNSHKLESLVQLCHRSEAMFGFR